MSGGMSEATMPIRGHRFSVAQVKEQGSLPVVLFMAPLLALFVAMLISGTTLGEEYNGI